MTTVDGVRGTAQHETPFSLINIHLDFIEEAILDHDYEIVDGNVKLTFSLNSETLLRTVNAQLNMEDFTLDNLGEIDNLGENYYHLAILLDGNTGLIQSLDLDISFTYEAEEEFDASMRANIEVTRDDEVNFEFPDNIDEFIEIGIIYLPTF